MGSATTIVVQKIRQDKQLFDEEHWEQGEHKNFANFISAPIVIDTNNFSENLKDTRWQIEDLEAFKWLSGFTDAG